MIISSNACWCQNWQALCHTASSIPPVCDVNSQWGCLLRCMCVPRLGVGEICWHIYRPFLHLAWSYTLLCMYIRCTFFLTLVCTELLVRVRLGCLSADRLHTPTTCKLARSTHNDQQLFPCTYITYTLTCSAGIAYLLASWLCGGLIPAVTKDGRQWLTYHLKAATCLLCFTVSLCPNSRMNANCQLMMA
jgi:hypothetical protein